MGTVLERVGLIEDGGLCRVFAFDFGDFILRGIFELLLLKDLFLESHEIDSLLIELDGLVPEYLAIAFTWYLCEFESIC
jgi:hypothetical protein